MRPEPSFFGRIGLSLLEFAPMDGDGEEERRRFGRIRIAKAELVQAWVGRELHTTKLLVIDRFVGRGGPRSRRYGSWLAAGGAGDGDDSWRRTVLRRCKSCTPAGGAGVRVCSSAAQRMLAIPFYYTRRRGHHM